jgi:cytochrome c553
MTMRTIEMLVATSLVLALVGCAAPERSRNTGNPNTPAKTLAEQVCSNCHELDGNSVSPNFPRLAAQQKPYVVAQLKGFRAHNRHDPAGFEYMWGLSRSLTDAQIDGLADYYAGQKPAGKMRTDPARAAAGKSIFENGIAGQNVPACQSCHGAQGQGNEQFPRLAGQHEDYVVKQLTVFQRTDERPEGAIMKIIAHELTQENMKNVAAYIQCL